MKSKDKLREALENWARVCKVADKELEKPYTAQTQIIINNLKSAKEYLENNSGCWVWHPLMDYDKEN